MLHGWEMEEGHARFSLKNQRVHAHLVGRKLGGRIISFGFHNASELVS